MTRHPYGWVDKANTCKKTQSKIASLIKIKAKDQCLNEAIIRGCSVKINRVTWVL